MSLSAKASWATTRASPIDAQGKFRRVADSVTNPLAGDACLREDGSTTKSAAQRSWGSAEKELVVSPCAEAVPRGLSCRKSPLRDKGEREIAL